MPITGHIKVIVVVQVEVTRNLLVPLANLKDYRQIPSTVLKLLFDETTFIAYAFRLAVHPNTRYQPVKVIRNRPSCMNEAPRRSGLKLAAMPIHSSQIQS